MGKLAEDMALASAELSPAWDAERSARLYAGMGKRRARRARVRRAGMAFASLCVVLAGAAFATRSSWQTVQPHAPLAANASHESPVSGTIRDAHTVRLVDGSRAQLFGAKSELEIVQNETARVGLRLHSGRAHFDVVPNTTRTFEVEAAPYRVVVLGTVFDVERSADQVTVAVTRGHVRVYGPRGAVDLLPGQRRSFESGDKLAKLMQTEPAPVPVAAVEPAQEAFEAERARRTPARRAASDALPSWRSLTQNGDYEAAFDVLARQRVVLRDPAELMDAADAARLSNHPDAAVGYLERVVKSHRKSPVAPLAAFTLGRVYLDRLGQPHKAASAFELARTIAPSGSLAQDALAREVEALSKGGDASKAYLRAREYMQRYPRGSRLRAVQLYGGIE